MEEFYLFLNYVNIVQYVQFSLISFTEYYVCEIHPCYAFILIALSIPFYDCTTRYIYPVDRHFDCFSFWAKMNIAVMNILLHIFWCTYICIFIEYITRSGITVS